MNVIIRKREEYMDDIKLYHGSRGGIQGPIRPISRDRCDFGRGFYMGTNLNQVKGLICSEKDPIVYELRIRLSEIPEDRILVVNGMEWAHIVLLNRARVPEFLTTQIAADLRAKIPDYDVIIGPIADDRMNDAMRSFENYSMTDKGLYHCLKSVNYGVQVVAKTVSACNLIDIISEKPLRGRELQQAQEYAYVKRNESRDVIQEAQRFYRNDGLYLDEIVARDFKRKGKDYEELYDDER